MSPSLFPNGLPVRFICWQATSLNTKHFAFTKPTFKEDFRQTNHSSESDFKNQIPLQMRKRYALKVWLTTLVLGNFLYFGVFMVLDRNINIDILVSIFAVLLGSVILSFPAFLLNVPVCRLISAGALKDRWAQTAIAGIGIGLIGCTFLPVVCLSAVVNGENPVKLYLAAGCYMVVSVIASFHFRLRASSGVSTAGMPASKLE